MMLPIWIPLSRLVQALPHDDAGAAAIEFALAAPLLIALLIPMIDLGAGFQQQMLVQDAAQAGAQYALAHGWNNTAIQSAVTSATALSGIQASPAPAKSCGCPQGTSVAAASCGGTCPSGQSVGTYVTVGAQVSYSPLIPYPMFGQSITLSAQSTVRIQ
jgi:Flp pilus assembly protein TadG